MSQMRGGTKNNSHSSEFIAFIMSTAAAMRSLGIASVMAAATVAVVHYNQTAEREVRFIFDDSNMFHHPNISSLSVNAIRRCTAAWRLTKFASR
jgi:hypothetical protein